MKLIVGLGNPGKKYIKTRHNIGFLVLDELAKQNSLADFVVNKKFHGAITEMNIGGEKIILIKPETFMNESGLAVRSLVDFYKLNAKDILVVHDDKDIELGKIKVQSGRSAAGHNGIQSIIDHVGGNEFTRLRIGVANNHLDKSDTAKFVLNKFGLFEKKKLKQVLAEAVSEIEKLLK